MTEPSDEQLVASARAGDGRALEVLLRRHHDRLAGLCRRMCRDRSDAEDATQNALIAIATNLDRFDGRSRFSTWSHRVAANAALDELRRRSRRPVPVDDEHRPEPVERAAGPESATLGRHQRDRLLRALDDLPDSFREVVLLRDVADLDYAEIAAALGISGGTVRSRIARGRARLAAALEDDPMVGNRPPVTDVQGGELP